MSSLPPAVYIATDSALATLAQDLAKEKLLAVDTESNSLHAYVGRVCLIQLSTRTQDYIIDPLAIKDMQPLGPLLRDPAIEKIFHAAEYDLICLKRDYDFDVVNLFDTMYAARVCGAKQIGLGDLLREHFGLSVDKSHQRDNWGQRPLPQDSLQYAQMDTHYLPLLRDKLVDRLTELKRLPEAQEVFADVSRIQVPERNFDPDGYWRIGRPHSLTRRQMGILREMFLEREAIAGAEDVPPFKIMSNKVLVNMSINPPGSMRELHSVDGLSSRLVRHYGNQLLAALDRGQKSRPPQPPQQERPDPVVAERYVVLHAWRKERAIHRDVESNIIVSKQTLWEMARSLPDTIEALQEIEGMGQWRLTMYGSELLDLIAQFRQNGK